MGTLDASSPSSDRGPEALSLERCWGSSDDFHSFVALVKRRHSQPFDVEVWRQVAEFLYWKGADAKLLASPSPLGSSCGARKGRLTWCDSNSLRSRDVASDGARETASPETAASASQTLVRGTLESEMIQAMPTPRREKRTPATLELSMTSLPWASPLRDSKPPDFGIWPDEVLKVSAIERPDPEPGAAQIPSNLVENTEPQHPSAPPALAPAESLSPKQRRPPLTPVTDLSNREPQTKSPWSSAPELHAKPIIFTPSSARRVGAKQLECSTHRHGTNLPAAATESSDQPALSVRLFADVGPPARRSGSVVGAPWRNFCRSPVSSASPRQAAALRSPIQPPRRSLTGPRTPFHASRPKSPTKAVTTMRLRSQSPHASPEVSSPVRVQSPSRVQSPARVEHATIEPVKIVVAEPVAQPPKQRPQTDIEPHIWGLVKSPLSSQSAAVAVLCSPNGVGPAGRLRAGSCHVAAGPCAAAVVASALSKSAGSSEDLRIPSRESSHRAPSVSRWMKVQPPSAHLAGVAGNNPIARALTRCGSGRMPAGSPSGAWPVSIQTATPGVPVYTPQVLGSPLSGNASPAVSPVSLHEFGHPNGAVISAAPIAKAIRISVGRGPASAQPAGVAKQQVGSTPTPLRHSPSPRVQSLAQLNSVPTVGLGSVVVVAQADRMVCVSPRF